MFFVHLVNAQNLPQGLTTDNLLAIVNEDLYPEIHHRRDEFYRRQDQGITAIALLIELNDLSITDWLVIKNGQLAFTQNERSL